MRAVQAVLQWPWTNGQLAAPAAAPRSKRTAHMVWCIHTSIPNSSALSFPLASSAVSQQLQPYETCKSQRSCSSHSPCLLPQGGQTAMAASIGITMLSRATLLLVLTVQLAVDRPAA